MATFWLLVSPLFFSLYAKESFISNDEYAKMLYKNPRGIGCDKCHGEIGEGIEISSYVKGNKRVSLYGPRINNLTSKRFYDALKQGNRLMPEYFLTDKEKAYLYYYLTTQNKLNQEKGEDVDTKE
ncbi:MAG: cytochrome c [Epsilonproteobacteria bacterium]|nr:cytochrome c [Campylobacterota bacterium]